MLVDLYRNRRLGRFESRVAVIVAHDEQLTRVQAKAVDNAIGKNQIGGRGAEEEEEWEGCTSSIGRCEIDACPINVQGVIKGKESIGKIRMTEIGACQRRAVEVRLSKVPAGEVAAGKV